MKKALLILGIADIISFIASILTLAHYAATLKEAPTNVLLMWLVVSAILYIPSFFIVFNRSQRNIFVFLIPIFIAFICFGLTFGLNLNSGKLGLEDGFLFTLEEDGTYSVEVVSIKGKDLDNFEFPCSYRDKPVTKIRQYSDDNFRKVRSVVIPDSVTTIDRFAFMGCDNLTRVVLSDGITAILYSTFNGCSNLNSIVISKNITTIESLAFYRCPKFADIYYTGSEEDWANISIDVYCNDALFNATIHYNYVPEE